MADARSLPMWVSPLAEIVATWAISAEVVISFLFFCRKSITASTAAWEPLLRSIGLHPAATFLTDSEKMALPRIVAEVVPSPALSLVLEATSCNSLAPKFSNLSSRLTLLATVTPSLVIFGAPNGCSIRTLRPLGPKVTATASARVSTPFKRAALPSTPNLSSL
ncbi:hypothetical protein OGATHE_006355 [Ogataea polymorpha]|uniref:Uncharacterized protein n=1 Tax=Ogataea polymorpha TaxID=460523 RepID=A0A9P8NT62_9ASCO|nr:hypothetical protein OGATHE_006355 [Ogataea polymorpha]